MFDSLADQIKHDEQEQVNSAERFLRWTAITVLSVVAFGGRVVAAVPVIVTARSVLTSLIRRLSFSQTPQDTAEDESRLPPNVIDPKSLL
jgi:hypothetical protein